MTAPVEHQHFNKPAGANLPDRRILSRRELDALSVIVDILGPNGPRMSVRDMECTEKHVFGGRLAADGSTASSDQYR